jgi:leucyl/phenylalanyl-tRNA---protein transferase
MRVPWLHDHTTPLPSAERAFPAGHELAGLVAAGGELTPARLHEAYTHGLFPWFSDGQPVLWWSPDPRMVLRPQDFKLHRSLRKVLKRFLATPGCEIRFDHDTRRVIERCSAARRPGQHGTWIVDDMVDAYTAWHAEGAVHSVETWVDGELVGGLYGVQLGRMFFGESMFALRTDASKLALAALVAWCLAHDIVLIDCQQVTQHLSSMGGAPMPRADFLTELRGALAHQRAGVWSYDASHWSLLPGFSAPQAPPPTPSSS